MGSIPAYAAIPLVRGTRGTCPLTCAGADEVAFDVLSRLFRRLFLRMLSAAHEANRLKFFANHASLTDPNAFATFLAPLRGIEWVGLRQEAISHHAGLDRVGARLERPGKVLGSATFATAIGRETGLGRAEHAATMAVLDPVQTCHAIVHSALQTQMDTANGLGPP